MQTLTAGEAPTAWLVAHQGDSWLCHPDGGEPPKLTNHFVEHLQSSIRRNTLVRGQKQAQGQDPAQQRQQQGSSSLPTGKQWEAGCPPATATGAIRHRLS